MPLRFLSFFPSTLVLSISRFLLSNLPLHFLYDLFVRLKLYLEEYQKIGM